MPKTTYTKALCSVCCLGYKHKNFIQQNIEALWNNNYKNIEIITLDDDSNDGSIELLKELQAKSPYPMQVLEQENTGNIGANMNKMFEHASGEFVLFMAFDDILKKDCISSKMQIMLNNPYIAFITNSLIETINCEGKFIKIDSSMIINKIDDINVEGLLRLEYENFHSYYIQGTCFRSEIIDIIGGYDEDMTGDDIVIRTKVAKYIQSQPAYNFQVLKSAGCQYRIHGNNIHKNRTRQIKIVTEFLQRFFPEKEDPQILINWVLSAINNLSYENYIKIFALNERTSKLLLNKTIQEAIKKKLVYYIPHKIIQLIYKKEKIGNKRILIFLSFIKFSYNKR